jgi:hypothetical protein
MRYTSGLNSVTRSLMVLTGLEHQFIPGELRAGRSTWQINRHARVVRFEQTEFGFSVEFNGTRSEYALNAKMPAKWMNWLDWLKDAPQAVA